MTINRMVLWKMALMGGYKGHSRGVEGAQEAAEPSFSPDPEDPRAGISDPSPPTLTPSL